MTPRVARAISCCGILACALALMGTRTSGWGWTIASTVPLAVATVLIVRNRPDR